MYSSLCNIVVFGGFHIQSKVRVKFADILMPNTSKYNHPLARDHLPKIDNSIFIYIVRDYTISYKCNIIKTCWPLLYIVTVLKQKKIFLNVHWVYLLVLYTVFIQYIFYKIFQQ